MRIAPEKLTGFIDVTIAHIDTAYKTCMTIDHNDLAVVAVVYPVGKKDEYDLVKWKGLYATSYQLISKFASDRTAAEVVINKAHLHPFLRLLYQNIFDLVANFIILKNVIFYMDMVFGILERLQNFRELIFAVYQKRHLVTAQQRAHPVIQQVKRQFFMLLDSVMVLRVTADLMNKCNPESANDKQIVNILWKDG